MSKSIKHMTYDIVNGKIVWRTIKPGETPRESVCPDCQIQRPKKNKIVTSGYDDITQQENILEGDKK